MRGKNIKTGKLVSDPTLNYFVSEPSNWAEYLNKDDLSEDKVHVNKYHETKIMPFTIKVQSNDPKGKYIKVRLQINKEGAVSNDF